MDVQISTGTAGKVRPPYRADPDEEDEADECYETPPKDRVVGDADAARVEGGWVSVLQWHPTFLLRCPDAARHRNGTA